MPAHLPILVIGYGNTLRSDDGVGPKVAETVADLHLPGVEVFARELLVPELADPVARARLVVFVDAAVDAPRQVQWRPLHPADSSRLLDHAADPRTLLALARDIFGRAPRAWWLTIPVENTAIGEGFSPFAQGGMKRAVQQLKRFLGAG